MSQHTPVKTETCLDCRVLPPFSIVLCPMHAAAPRMLTYIEKDAASMCHKSGFQGCGDPYCRGCEARALLKEIEG